MAFSPNIKYYVYTLHIVNINIQIVNSWVFDLTKLNLIRLKNKEGSQCDFLFCTKNVSVQIHCYFKLQFRLNVCDDTQIVCNC